MVKNWGLTRLFKTLRYSVPGFYRDKTYSPLLQVCFKGFKKSTNFEIISWLYIKRYRNRKTLKELKPYWFLQEPVDVEHKFYVLMDFLQSVDQDLSQKKYNEQIQKVRRIYDDLKSFKEKNSITNKSMMSMTKREIEIMRLLEESKDKQIDELEALVDNSIDTLEKFVERISPIIKEINESITVKLWAEDVLYKDNGFLVLRIPKSRKIRVYSWMFSIIRVENIDQIGLLLTEVLGPLPQFSKSDEKIVKFINSEIKKLNEIHDAVIFADLDISKGIKEVGFDLLKEKGIDFIVKSYREYLQLF